ncbi:MULTISPECIES: hypothetical protein [unclassified Beijerinckia]|uniref:hypothetical protein n=1 Tax=unclassified Beijerinckia TaxID=2638183 RepID=UPI000B873848|nr:MULTISPECIES: hypothetical protein [unclassified Beijerinckia]
MRWLMVLPLIAVVPAVAEEKKNAADADIAAAVTVGLRGGFDTNPIDIQDGRSSPFGGQTFSFEMLRATSDSTLTVKADSGANVFMPSVSPPQAAQSLTVEGRVALRDDLALRGTMSANTETSYSRKAINVLTRGRADYDTKDFRAFSSLEAKITSLNERNIFAMGGFLPEAEVFGTFTSLTGGAIKTKYGEFGLSLLLSHVRYGELDYIGLQRTHNRIQPNFFFSNQLGPVSLDGSLSYFTARFSNQLDFNNVQKVLYTGRAKLPIGDSFSLEANTYRSISDTTLPFSALVLSTSYDLRGTYKFSPTTAVGAFARWKKDEYLGLFATTTAYLFGVEYGYRLPMGIVGSLTVAARHTEYQGQPSFWSGQVQVGLQRRFDMIGAPEQASTSTSPILPSVTLPALTNTRPPSTSSS